MPSYIYTPIVAEAHTAPYKIHKYFARRPHNVFEQLVDDFTDKGETILDPFCGGGVTIYEGIKKERKVIGCDLNPLSIFVVNSMVEKGCFDEKFKSIIQEVIEYITFLQSDAQTYTLDGKEHKILWYELCFEVRCPKCGRTTPLCTDTKHKDGWYVCSNEFCEHSKDAFKVSDIKRTGHRYLYASIEKEKGREYVSLSHENTKKIDNHIAFLKSEMAKNNIEVPQDVIPINWDRQFEDGLSKKGILYFQDFFTKRNLFTLLLLKNKIQQYKEALSDSQYQLLRIAFSNTLKETNVMSFTNDGWQGGRPTSWSKHAYWIPNQFCESNILDAFNNSIDRIRKSVIYNDGFSYNVKKTKDFSSLQNDGNIFLFNGTVSDSGIESNSIDAIITDPPYGSNVQYLELSHFWFPWNKDLYEKSPDFSKEAISNRKKGFKGAKDQYTYETNLYSVFSKAYDVLKEDRYMTLTFNNKDMASWLGLLFSIFKAGFSFHDIYFQDGVEHYKNTSHTKAKGSPYGDFIYVFKKGKPEYEIRHYENENDFIKELDAMFQEELSSDASRNEIILGMMRKSVPMIDGFAKSMPAIGEHNVYASFPKNYLEKLYK